MSEERKTKPGWKTTEFWLSLIVLLTGIAIIIIDATVGEASTAGKIVGGIVALLGAMGYAVPRAGVKRTEIIAKHALPKARLLKNGDDESS